MLIPDAQRSLTTAESCRLSQVQLTDPMKPDTLSPPLK